MQNSLNKIILLAFLGIVALGMARADEVLRSGAVIKEWGLVDDFLAERGLRSHISSGCRSVRVNERVGGSPTSFHMLPGCARDVYGLNYDQRVKLVAEAIKEGFFAQDEVDHVHIDIGGYHPAKKRIEIFYNLQERLSWQTKNKAL